MGQSPTATLFFGYVFTDEDEYPWEKTDDYELREERREKEWDENHFYAHALGKDPDAMTWEELADLFKEAGVVIDRWGCLYDATSYFIRPADPNTWLHTSWDGPATVDIGMFTNNDAYVAWHTPLQEFAKLMGIDLEGQVPRWHMVASYG